MSWQSKTKIDHVQKLFYHPQAPMTHLCFYFLSICLLFFTLVYFNPPKPLGNFARSWISQPHECESNLSITASFNLRVRPNRLLLFFKCSLRRCMQSLWFHDRSASSLHNHHVYEFNWINHLAMEIIRTSSTFVDAFQAKLFALGLTSVNPRDRTPRLMWFYKRHRLVLIDILRDKQINLKFIFRN